MKWRGLLLLVGALALACAFALSIRPGKRSESRLHLQVLREIRDHGKLVVFFRLEGATGRRISVTSLKSRKMADRLHPILLDDVEMTLVGDRGATVIDTGPAGYTPLFSTPVRLWTPSRRFALSDPRTARNEFGVFAPTDASVWKLEAMVQFLPTPLERFRARLDVWKAYWQARLFPNASTTTKVVQITWSTRGFPFGMEVESGLIVNPTDQP
jgi:hypothetical protein